ncbi:MAG TPA: protein kinase [Archangium sp.]|uniref:serine/threonine protein kinase n=1 Tax=Archangium sp. TaxID=1872627 RepID=UPI002ED835D1
MQPVGKYQLIRKLATGGMAEVYLAKAAGPMGFEKTLVLKRILPHLAEEPAFVEMFLSEAKLAARLTHPNIVQIFDFGETDGAYFLAMEYIDGPSLRTLIKRASAQDMPLPLTACARLVAHACEGLAFAHDFTDPETGESLELIHRDISPDNILLSKQGGVKVVDFGIAKAAGQGHKTASGVIKGKLSYMPPEQVRAEPLDRRVDVYALGVVLYELLTGHKPFESGSEVGLMRAILTQSPMPAVQFRPELPDSLRRVLGRALAKDREQRYPDCHAFQSDLEEFILSVGKPVTTQQIAQLIAQVAASTDRSTPTPQPGTPPAGPTPSVSPVLTQPSPTAKTDVEPSPAQGTVKLRKPEAMKQKASEAETAKLRKPEAMKQEASEAETAKLRKPEAMEQEAPEAETAKLHRPEAMKQEAPEAETAKLRKPEAMKQEVPEAGRELPTVPDVRPRPRATLPSTRIQRPPLKPPRKGNWVPMTLAGVVLIVAGGGVVVWRMPSSASAPQEAMRVAEREPLPAMSLSVEPPPAPVPEPSTNSPGALTPERSDGGSLLVIQDTPTPPKGSSPGSTPPPTEVAASQPSPQEPNASTGAGSSNGDVPPVNPTKPSPKVSPKLAVRKGTLEIRVRPYATVFLSGKELGDTPIAPIELAPGTYIVTLVNKSIPKTVTKSVEVNLGESTVLPVNLFNE